MADLYNITANRACAFQAPFSHNLLLLLYPVEKFSATAFGRMAMFDYCFFFYYHFPNFSLIVVVLQFLWLFEPLSFFNIL